MKGPPGNGTKEPAGGWLPTTWVGWIVLILWIVTVALFLQFAIASMQELEPQAAILGWILVAMLLVGGITVWAANAQSSNRRR